MFPNTHPDVMGQLVNDRIADLRADAGPHRRSRPFLARRRPARNVEPTADLSRIVPVEAPRPDRAA